MSDGTYLVAGPAGTFEFAGADVTDEVFSHQEFGTINVTKAWTLVPDRAKPYRVALDQNIVQHLRFRDLDGDVLSKMTPSRMRDPVLCVLLPTGVELIDGAHRIEKRRQKGRSWYEAFLLIPEAIEKCRVRVFRHEADGSKIEVDTRYGPMGFQPTNGWAPGNEG